MRELFEGPNTTVPDVRSPKDLSADIFTHQITDYNQRPGNNSRPANDNDAADVINSSLNRSSLYGEQSFQGSQRPADRNSQPTSANDTHQQPPSLEEALRWAKSNMYRLDGNHDGGISRREIGLADLGHRLSPEDQRMADVLMEQL